MDLLATEIVLIAIPERNICITIPNCSLDEFCYCEFMSRDAERMDGRKAAVDFMMDKMNVTEESANLILDCNEY